MSCKEIEEEIYLYRELTASQKAIVDTHIKQCASCQALFATVQGYQSVAYGLAENKPHPQNHARLTSNVMQAVAQSTQKKNGFSVFLESSFVKYAFVAASLLLAILFGAEQLISTHTTNERISTVRTVTLNSTSVAEVLQSQKEKRNVSLYVCIKTGECAISIIENYKQKKF